jgi:IS6 family transposase
VFVSARRDAKAAHRFFERAIGTTAIIPVEVVTDQAAAAYPGGAGRAAPGGLALPEQYATNRVEGDHGRLKARLRPMRGLQQDHSVRVVITGHAFVQNIRRAHYERRSRRR